MSFAENKLRALLRSPKRALPLLPCLLAATVAHAQYPGHIDKNKASQTPDLRATAVLEWTGQPGKPSASRMVPIAVFDGDTYQPGGLYLAQPEPLAVESGTEYVLQQSGEPKGLFDIFSAQNVQGAWFGYGVWKPWTVPPPPKLQRSKHMPEVVKDAGSDRPSLKNKSGDSTASNSKPSDSDESSSGAPTLHRRTSDSDSSGNTSQNSGNAQGSSSTTQTTDSSDRPTLHKRTSDPDASSGGSQPDTSTSSDTAQSGNGSSANKQSSDTSQTTTDPDRPTLHRRSDTESSASGGGAGTGSVDPDRPRLHKPAEAAGAGGSSPDAPETAVAGSDPNRPHLQRGRPKELDAALAPDKLTGRPPELEQMVAVSDSRSREPHSFAYQWSDPAEAAKMQAALEDLARKALVPSAAAPVPSSTKTAATRRASARRTRSSAAAAPIALADEKFQSYELSYSGGATLIFSAKYQPDAQPSAGAAAKTASAAAPSPNASEVPTRYVTIIAQPDFYGVPQVVLKSVTADNRLDVTPRMRLVDAADTDGDNRAELIFELRSKTDRQFAIYKVAHGRAEQVFNTGSVP